jgi:hypothetical protein
VATLDLDSFSSLLIETESGVEEDIAGELSDLEIRLVTGLSHVAGFGRADVAGPTPAPADALLVRVSVTEIRRVSKTQRLLKGAFAGRALIAADVDLVDAPTETPLTSFRLVAESGGSGLAGGTEEAVEQAVLGVAEIIGKHRHTPVAARVVDEPFEVSLGGAERAGTMPAGPDSASPHRRGLSIGLGAGFGQFRMKQKTGDLSRSTYDVSFRARLQLGASLSEQFHLAGLYLLDVHPNQYVDPLEESENLLDLAVGLFKWPARLLTNHVTLMVTGSYYLKPTVPAFYGGAGVGVSMFPSPVDYPGLKAGTAWSVFAGYEWHRGWQVQLEALHGTSTEPTRPYRTEREAWNITIEVQKVWF